MELLLNLVWAMLAFAAAVAFWRARRSCAPLRKTPYCKALIALSCAVWLLFPVVSASDDLHPTQAVFEDASKRLQQMTPAYQFQHSSSDMFTVLLAWVLLMVPVVLYWSSLRPLVVASSNAFRVPLPARAPPIF
jgi:hypothetical protein